jgi:hypothetical protein
MLLSGEKQDMTDQNRVSQWNHPHPDLLYQSTLVRRLSGLCMAGIILGCAAATAWAQTTPEESARISRLNAARAAFDIGTALKAPRQIEAAAPRRLPISCRVICSPFEPRQALAEITWPEQGRAASVDEKSLRLDIIGAPSKFNEGNFGTVRLSAVPIAEFHPGVGVDLATIRKSIRPAMIQRVEKHRILVRDPALPAPEAIKQERLPEGRMQLPQAAMVALERDAQTGAFGRMQVVAQSIEVKRSIPHRNLVLEGLQPGLSYKIRLVEEGATAADSLAEDICRVPVCPADFYEAR